MTLLLRKPTHPSQVQTAQTSLFEEKTDDQYLLIHKAKHNDLEELRAEMLSVIRSFHHLRPSDIQRTTKSVIDHVFGLEQVPEEMSIYLKQWNKAHPKTPLQIIRRGGKS